MKRSTRAIGERFGYPNCCIDDCISRVEAGFREPSQEQLDAANNTGFIPCPAHAGQIQRGEIALVDLITGRTHPRPFPQD